MALLIDGAVQVVATAELFGAEFLTTFTAADDFTLQDVNHVKFVLIFFAVLLSVGASSFVLVVCYRNREVKKDLTLINRATFRRTRLNNVNSRLTNAQIRSSLKHYINQLIPVIYRAKTL